MSQRTRLTKAFDEKLRELIIANPGLAVGGLCAAGRLDSNSVSNSLIRLLDDGLITYRNRGYHANL
jgi:hypothetical protein